MNPAETDWLVDRHFVRLADGRLLHYRAAGKPSAGRPPLVLAHAGPGSSLGLVPLIRQLSRHRLVIAPDMPGNGDSEPLPVASPRLSDYVAQTVEMLDLLGIGQVDFCGQHAGAHIGCELALQHPTRVRRLMLDGLGLYEADLLAEMVAHYAPVVVPDEFGGHMAWAWRFVNDLFLHFPYHMRDPAHRLHGPMPPAAARQALTVDLLKALPTYHLSYHAVFAHRTAERIALLRHPTLLMAADGDPLGVYLDAATALVPGATSARMPREGRSSVIAQFLDAA